MNKLMHSTNMTGQSIVDRALAAKYTVSGQSLAKVICKATTEEIMGPKRKHLDYLLHCTNESNISIPQMANLLIERTQSGHWVVVFKALVTVHNLMNYGNERFTQYLASMNSSFNLSNFTERSGNQGYDMSPYVRRYSKYLNEKAYSYRLMAFDFCKVKRGKDDGFLRTMNTEKLLKSLPILQQQLDTLIEFDVTANELTNGVINSAFMLLFKDLIRLFACYNDGIINLLEKYFDMNKKNAKEALEVYKKFLARMDRTCEFLKVAENVGIDKGDIPDLAKAPSSLLDALEQHLASLEGKKSGTAVTLKPGQGISATISSYAAQSQAGAAPGAGASIGNISEEERQKILEEEQRQLDQMKQQRLRQMEATGKTAKPNPSTNNSQAKLSPLNSPMANNPPLEISNRTAPINNSKPLDDPFLLNLDPIPNSGLDSLGGSFAIPAASQNTFNPFGGNPPFQQPMVSQAWAVPIYSTPNASLPPQQFGNNFNADPNFATAFPQNSVQPARFDNFGEILRPVNATPSLNGDQNKSADGNKFIQTDLDSSLACLAGNLSILPSGQIKKTEHQWTNKPTEKKLTGSGQTWNTPSNPGQAWNTAWPNQQAMMTNNNMPSYAIPILYATPPPNMQWGIQPQHMMPNQMVPNQLANMNGFSSQPNNWGSRPQNNNPSSNVNDPFGAL